MKHTAICSAIYREFIMVFFSDTVD